MPYQPQFTVSARLVGELETIAVLRERILAATVQVPWMPSLQRDARVRSTHSSTAIEGNPLTLEQVRLIEEGTWTACRTTSRKTGSPELSRGASAILSGMPTRNSSPIGICSRSTRCSPPKSWTKATQAGIATSRSMWAGTRRPHRNW